MTRHPAAQLGQRVDRPAVADRGQHVVQLAFFGARVAHVVRDDDRQAELAGQARGLGDQPVVVGQEVVRELEDEAGGCDPPCRAPAVRRRRRPEAPRVALRDGPRTLAVAGPEPPGQLAVAAPRERDEALRVLREEGLGDRGAALVPARLARETSRRGCGSRSRRARAGRGADRAAPRRSPRWSSLPAARWPGSRARSGRGRAGRPSPDASAAPWRPGPAPRSGRQRAAPGTTMPRVRDGGVEQLDLDADDRVEAGLLGRRREPDDAVQALAIGDRKAARPSSTARSTSSAGAEAPSRNEKWV